MKWQMRRPALFTIALLAAACAAPRAAPGDPADWIGRASFVFTGSVDSIGTTPETALLSEADAVIVRIETVHEKPASVRLSEGETVAVQGGGAESLKPGTRATFYATGEAYGRTLALRAVGYEVDDGPIEAHAAKVKMLRSAANDAGLRARAHSAAAVVVGHVTSVQAARESNAIDSEHDPEWHVAMLDVEEGLKGAKSGENLRVRFAASLDLTWARSPKLRADQRGLFLLRKPSDSDDYLLVDPDDLLAVDQAERVRALTAGGR